MSEKKNIGPRMGGGMPGEKPKNFKATLSKLLRYMGAYRYALAIVLVITVISTTLAILGPDILGQATTEIFAGLQAKVSRTGGIDFDKLAGIMLTIIALYGASALLEGVVSWMMTGISQKLSLRMRAEISEKIHRMPIKYFESQTVGDILSRITNDVNTLSNLSQSVTRSIGSVSSLIGIFIMMLRINVLMTVIGLVILPVSALLMSIVIKMSQKHFVEQQRLLGEINGKVEEVFSGQTIVKVFNREDAVLDEFSQSNKGLYTSAWKSQFLSGIMMPIMMFVGNLGYVLVAVVGAVMASKGHLTVGNIQAFIQYMRSVSQHTGGIAQVSNLFQSTAAAAERIFEFLEEAEEVPSPSNPVSTDELSGRVEFRNVHFGYDPENPVIQDFSAVVEPGQMVAIVGPTGAGKTTMVKLLMRFYDVDSGEILVDGHNLRDYDRGALRENFGMVLQETWLFKGTVMENIRYGRLNATDDEVIAAAKAAHVHHFIKTLAGGYNCELAEDATNISQGQRQLLTIARAILADNKIMILDEATSSVDTRTEQRIQLAMSNLMRGRTSFVIAHRLSTIKGADLILVMRDGDIVEQGKHEELLAQGGFYAELYNSQFEQVG